MFICEEDQHEWRHWKMVKVIMKDGTTKENVGAKRCCICGISRIYSMVNEQFEKWDSKEAKEKHKE